MRVALLMLAALCAAAPAHAQTKPNAAAATAASTDCASLSASYEDVGKDIAKIDASGSGDNSAPRETMRQIQINTQYQRAAIATSLMVAKKCPLPASLPNDHRYRLAALECRNAELEWEGALIGKDKAVLDQKLRKQLDACDIHNWSPR